MSEDLTRAIPENDSDKITLILTIGQNLCDKLDNINRDIEERLSRLEVDRKRQNSST